MTSIHACELPDVALLRKYAGARTHTDCYATDIARAVSQSDYVEAFYTTRVFKLERWLLRWLASRPSTDAEAKQLASGKRSAFAAWTVEEQTAHQLLMCDITGRTRSWLMVASVDNGQHPSGTRLYFGSAVVAVTDERSGKSTLGFTYRALLGFHKLYSRILLHAASARVARQRSGA